MSVLPVAVGHYSSCCLWCQGRGGGRRGDDCSLVLWLLWAVKDASPYSSSLGLPATGGLPLISAEAGGSQRFCSASLLSLAHQKSTAAWISA